MRIFILFSLLVITCGVFNLINYPSKGWYLYISIVFISLNSFLALLNIRNISNYKYVISLIVLEYLIMFDSFKVSLVNIDYLYIVSLFLLIASYTRLKSKIKYISIFILMIMLLLSTIIIYTTYGIMYLAVLLITLLIIYYLYIKYINKKIALFSILVVLILILQYNNIAFLSVMFLFLFQIIEVKGNPPIADLIKKMGA